MLVAFQSAYFIVYQDKKITSPALPGVEDSRKTRGWNYNTDIIKILRSDGLNSQEIITELLKSFLQAWFFQACSLGLMHTSVP